MNGITATIKGAMDRNGLDGLHLSKITGIRYSTLNYRWTHPGTWRLIEWSALLKTIDFLPDEMELIGKEVKKL